MLARRSSGFSLQQSGAYRCAVQGKSAKPKDIYNGNKK
jgi:hypothetical protein